MATLADYRAQLNNKFVGLEDEGYGDFEFTDTELNTYIEFAIARLFPAVYARVSLDNQTPTQYGTAQYGYVATLFAPRVFMVEDAVELENVPGWRTGGGGTRIQGIDLSVIKRVNIYYTDAFALPVDPDDDVGLDAIYTPLVVLGALIEALESRHDTGIRGEPAPTGTHYETQLIDRLIPRYKVLKDDLAMALPGVQF